METSEGGREACASSEQLPIDSLDDPLLCRVLFLAGKPNWCAAGHSGGAAPVPGWRRTSLP